jgi:hypothetical protein
LDLDVCLLNLFPRSHEPKPLLDHRIVVKRKASKRIQTHPRLKMIINGTDTTGHNTLTASLLQLGLENIIATIGLGRVSLQRIVILL